MLLDEPEFYGFIILLLLDDLFCVWILAISWYTFNIVQAVHSVVRMTKLESFRVSSPSCCPSHIMVL